MDLRCRRPTVSGGVRRGLDERRDLWTARASRVACLVCAFWLGMGAGVAHADKLTDAEELFRRAKGLMAANKDEEACPLLEESQRLDPQMGTLLNLAICHENIGKTASAWGEFRAVEQQARAANRGDRVKLAHERAAKLESKLARLAIVVPVDAKAEGLVVKVDGEAKGEPLWSGMAVDPGTRTVEASAPGKMPAVMQVTVDDAGTASVTIPRLEDEPVAAPAPARAPDVGRMRDEEYAANRARKTTGIVVGAVGVAAMVGGGVFGLLAISNDGDATKACPSPCFAGSREARAADDATDRALLFANVANVALPVGVLAAAVGGYMFLGAGPTDKPAVSAQLAPRPGGGALVVSW